MTVKLASTLQISETGAGEAATVAAAMDADVAPRNYGLSDQDVEFIQTNVGSVAQSGIAVMLGISPARLVSILKKMGMKDMPFVGLPTGLGIDHLPLGTVRYRTSVGVVHRIPTSTPGIVSRTIYSQWDEKDDEAIASDDDRVAQAADALNDCSRAFPPPGAIKVPDAEVVASARSARKASRSVRPGRAVQAQSNAHAAV